MISMNSISPTKQRKWMLWLFTGFLAVLALGIMLMPIGGMNKEKNMLFLYLSGCSFWVGILGTICMICLIHCSRKRNSQFMNDFGNMKRYGFMQFFQNKEAVIADCVMFASGIGFVISRICVSHLILSFILLAIFVFSFGMHCMLNGNDYRYLKYGDMNI